MSAPQINPGEICLIMATRGRPESLAQAVQGGDQDLRVAVGAQLPGDIAVVVVLPPPGVVADRVADATLAAFAPAMRAAGRGTLCGVASVSGFRGLAGAGGYCASKAAAITWLESLRVELRGSGVSVVTVCPGYIDTPLTRVNRYRMPFLLPADEAARRIARAIDAKRRLAVIPWQMALVSYPLRALPEWLYDRLAARAPRKPRNVKI